MAKNKWFLFYLHYTWERQRNEIACKEFDSELDMLVWAADSAIPKGWNLHHIVSPDGLTHMPAELYERIEHLRKKQSAEEQKQEKREEPVKRPRGRPRKNKETVCTMQ